MVSKTSMREKVRAHLWLDVADGMVATSLAQFTGLPSTQRRSHPVR
jgi:hypothetical protein